MQRILDALPPHFIWLCNINSLIYIFYVTSFEAYALTEHYLLLPLFIIYISLFSPTASFSHSFSLSFWFEMVFNADFMTHSMSMSILFRLRRRIELICSSWLTVKDQLIIKCKIKRIAPSIRPIHMQTFGLCSHRMNITAYNESSQRWF